MNYGGSLKISVEQMPPHKHDLKIHYNNGSITGEYGAAASSTGDVLAWRDVYIGNTGGGGQIIIPTISPATYITELLRIKGGL